VNRSFSKLKSVETVLSPPSIHLVEGLSGAVRNEFLIEPRLASPNGEKWLFSRASLSTAQHEKLLQDLSKEFKK
jgi:hypothetical protein